MFSSALPRAERYAGLLATEGVVRGLIGPREAPRLWERHLVNCALLGEALPEGTDVCDLGSGAGLPGLVLALARPDLTVTLVEPLLRRTTFLEEAVEALGLGNVEVVRARAEELHGRRTFTAVTSRALAPLSRLLTWSMPLVAERGCLLAMKGSSVQEEIAAAQATLRRYGEVEVVTYGAGLIDPPTTVVRVEAGDQARLGWEGRGQRKPGAARAKKSTPRGRGR